jgi:hypothetical protein
MNMLSARSRRHKRECRRENVEGEVDYDNSNTKVVPVLS